MDGIAPRPLALMQQVVVQSRPCSAATTPGISTDLPDLVLSLSKNKVPTQTLHIPRERRVPFIVCAIERRLRPARSTPRCPN